MDEKFLQDKCIESNEPNMEKQTKKEFVHLHVHSEYSLLDGAARICKGKSSPLIDAVKAKGMSAIAITDHGNMFGVYSFVKAAKAGKIKGIIGSEFYFVKDRFVKDVQERTGNHLILIAKNNEGYKNLMRLSSLSYTEGFYFRPRIDMDALKKFSKGLICLTACIQGAVPDMILNDNYEGAKRHALELKELFDEGDFYIELQNHGIEKELKANPQLVKLAKEIGVKVVATNDVHYIEKSDADMQDVLMCINMKTQLSDPNRLKLDPQEFYLKTYDEMFDKFSWCPEALDNTVEIANKCDVTIKLEVGNDKYEIPVYEINDEKYKDIPTEDGQREAAYLRDLANAGLLARYGNVTKEVDDRAKMELEVIIKMGFAGYYLIVWDFVSFAKKQGIPVGPGRGSGVGSIIAYAIGITNLDPIKYNLLFERFLSTERVSMPDFDIDFCTVRRAEVISYVEQKYGKDRVAQIITYGTLSARAVIKDIARVYSIPYGDADKWAKAIPNVPKITINEVLGLIPYTGCKNAGATDEEKRENQKHFEEERAKRFSPDFKKYYDEDIVAKGIIDMALRVENMPRQTGMHAAGVLICPKPVYEYVPLQKSGECTTTQFDKVQVEAMGLLKMDFLGLNTLTDIKLALDYIEETTGNRPDLNSSECDDPEVYKYICRGDTKAIFQLENEGMRKFIVQLQPNCLEEIIAGVALYRPGPMQFIPDYIKGKNEPDSVTYLHPMLKNILELTHGCIVYQEQVMQIAREVAGYSFGQADELRRAMGKKEKEKMLKHEDCFINGKTDENGKVVVDGAVRRGMSVEIAKTLYEQIKKFAEYAFNKSHAAAYSVITYQTAWLKCYYPLHFMAAVLNNRITKAEEVSNYINYLNSINVKVLPPNINKSQVKFSIDENNLRFGLMAIKNVGEIAVEAVITERNKNGEFSDLEDFVSRIGGNNLNKRMVESMIKGGAFDCFNRTRATLINSYEQIMENMNQYRKNRDSGQISLFDELLDDDFNKFKYVDIAEYSEHEKLMNEKDVLGMYVTGHPLNSFREALDKLSFNTSMLTVIEPEDDDVVVLEDNEIGYKTVNYDKTLNGKKIKIGGVINAFERKLTKKSESMGVGIIEDLYGQIEFILYSRRFDVCRDMLYVNAFVVLEGTLVIKEDENPKINVWSVSPLAITDKTSAEQSVDIAKNKSKLILTISGERAKVTPIVKEVRKILTNCVAGDCVVIIKVDWADYVIPERVKFSSELEYDIGVIIGRNNISIEE
ncbi:MAG: DNA polymerase III subunit alpha [Clostridia bacterium]